MVDQRCSRCGSSQVEAGKLRLVLRDSLKPGLREANGEHCLKNDHETDTMAKDDNKMKKKLRTRKEWELETLGPALAKRPERDTEFSTVSSLPIERLSAPEDLEGWNPDEKLGFPGE